MGKTSLILAVVLAAGGLGAAGQSPQPGSDPYTLQAGASGHADVSPLDGLVLARLRQLGIEPAGLCSDAVFLRRAYLDVIGTPPTMREAREFLADRNPDKRSALVERLLNRPEFTDYWAMKWSDVLRVKSEFPINLWPNAVQAYHRWIHTCIRDNVPYDRFARELLTSSGSNFRVPPVNFYRAVQSNEPQTLAQAVALTFMGVRAEDWPKDRLDGMAAFFSCVGYKYTLEWKEEIVFFDPNARRTEDRGQKTEPSSVLGPPSSALRAVFPDGTSVRLSADRDPRAVFADWLIRPENPWFTRNIVNRVWSWLLGRGIVHEPDDIRPDNPPSNPELLAYLEKELIAARYDLKHLFRLILNSRTYQLSSIPASDHPQAAANFAFYPLRRLEAEVLIDALNQITGTTEKYSSAIPEPFTFIPEDQRSIAMADGSITSSFLELFGRSARDTGMESERNNRPTASQRLHMLNSSHVQRKIEQGPAMQNLMRSKAKPQEVVNQLYLTILSRYPTDEEVEIVAAYVPPGAAKSREAAVDLAWALINSAEFLYRH